MPGAAHSGVELHKQVGYARKHSQRNSLLNVKFSYLNSVITSSFLVGERAVEENAGSWDVKGRLGERCWEEEAKVEYGGMDACKLQEPEDRSDVGCRGEESWKKMKKSIFVREEQ